MNNTIQSFYSGTEFSIELCRHNNDLIDGLFIIGANKRSFEFTAIIDIINANIQSISFVIDWQQICQNVIEAQTAFNGYIKLNAPSPLVSLNWLLVQRHSYSPDVQFTTSGKSLLCEDYRPEYALQIQNLESPYPKIKSGTEIISQANSMVQTLIT